MRSTLNGSAAAAEATAASTAALRLAGEPVDARISSTAAAVATEAAASATADCLPAAAVDWPRLGDCVLPTELDDFAFGSSATVVAVDLAVLFGDDPELGLSFSFLSAAVTFGVSAATAASVAPETAAATTGDDEVDDSDDTDDDDVVDEAAAVAADAVVFVATLGGVSLADVVLAFATFDFDSAVAVAASFGAVAVAAAGVFFDSSAVDDAALGVTVEDLRRWTPDASRKAPVASKVPPTSSESSTALQFVDGM